MNPQLTLELDPEEARFLAEHLARHAQNVEDELVHTDKRQLQSELARDLERLRVIQGRVAALSLRRYFSQNSPSPA